MVLMQHFLDPRDLSKLGTEYEPDEIPSVAVCRFGYYPDISLLLPGDLILVHNLHGNISHKIIEQVQARAYQLEHSKWHHAAVYLGHSDDICEADLAGVCTNSLDRYACGKHLIRVRRGRDLDENTRWRIAIRALTRLRQSYSYSTILDTGYLAIKRFKQHGPIKRTSNSGLICSQLYSDAYQTATRTMLANRKCNEVTPAFLSSTKSLDDVPLTWRPLAQF
jgi:hypothetical protein